MGVVHGGARGASGVELLYKISLPPQMFAPPSQTTPMRSHVGQSLLRSTFSKLFPSFTHVSPPSLSQHRSSSSVSLSGSSQPETETVCASRLRKCPLGTCQPVRERAAGRWVLPRAVAVWLWWCTVLERPRLCATAASKVSVSTGLCSSSCDVLRNGDEGG